MERARLADQYHQRGFNCAQAVACAFQKELGLSEEQIGALLSCFGGGLRTGEVCGAVSGAAVVLGAKFPHAVPEDWEAKELSAEKIRKFQRKFREKFGRVTCRELKPMEVDPSVSPAARELGITSHCGIYIAAAVEILEEMLGE